MESIDQMLEKYGLKDTKHYKAKVLYLILKDIGIIDEMQYNSFITDWLRRNIMKGLILLPTKSITSRWKIQGLYIKGIVKAFVPGGTGAFDFKHL